MQKIVVVGKYGYAGTVYIQKEAKKNVFDQSYYMIFDTEWGCFPLRFFYSGNILQEFRNVSIDYIWEKITAYLGSMGLRYTHRENERKRDNFEVMFWTPFKETLAKEVQDA